jgi:ApbE superfamily uncharacterized protein (UPF0280 family)
MPQANWLPDGQRLHLQHGPIDLVIRAWGEDRQVTAAYHEASRVFDNLLQTLADELSVLRSPLHPDGMQSPRVSGPVAQRMLDATLPFGRQFFITPMAAVAGAVADFVMTALWQKADLERAYVNNGGDIAFRLTPGKDFTVAICQSPETGIDGGQLTLRPSDGISGLATSGWNGRSHSLGIADAVTVLAQNAATADAAATLIANAVDLPGDKRIQRVPACELNPDSDLGGQLVTTAVPALETNAVAGALDAGQAVARAMVGSGQIVAAVLNCQGVVRTCGLGDGVRLVPHSVANEESSSVICS